MIFLENIKGRRRISQLINRYRLSASWLLKCRCIFFGRQPLCNVQKNFSVKESAPINNPIVRSHPQERQGLKRLCLSWLRPGDFEATGPSIWEYILYVSVSIVMVIMIGRFVFSIATERTGSIRAKQAAIELYKQYSLRLDEISKKHADELKSVKKVN